MTTKHHGRVGVPSDLDDEDNWRGGFYELALELGQRDDDRLERALLALWQEATVSGCFRVVGRHPLAHAGSALGLREVEDAGQLHGVTRLPAGEEVVCGAGVVREDAGVDWLYFFVPLGALGRTNPQIGGFPFDEEEDSLVWRRPIDKWLSVVGTAIYRQVDFRLGLIGHEASGEDASRLGAEAPPDRFFGYLMPADSGLRYFEATR